MRWRPVGWVTVWLILALYLLGVCGALVLTWRIGEAEERYINGFGVDIGVSATFSDGGRWLATAVLGVSALLGLAAVVWLAVARRPAPRSVPEFSTTLDALAPAATPGPSTPPPPMDPRPPLSEETTGRYRAALVGDEVTRRSERAVPPAWHEGEPPIEGRPNADDDAIRASEHAPAGR